MVYKCHCAFTWNKSTENAILGSGDLEIFIMPPFRSFPAETRIKDIFYLNKPLHFAVYPVTLPLIVLFKKRLIFEGKCHGNRDTRFRNRVAFDTFL